MLAPRLILCLSATLGLVACGPGAPAPSTKPAKECEAVCDDGQARCDGTIVESCAGSAWVAVQDCALLGKSCATDGGTPACTAAACRDDQVFANGKCFDLDGRAPANDSSGPTTREPLAPVIERFDADAYQGLAPFETSLHWAVTSPSGSRLRCEVDLDGDGKAETVDDDCSTGEATFVYEPRGRYNALLTVDDGDGHTARRGQVIFANALERAPNTVALAELPGLVDVAYGAHTIELTLAQGEHVSLSAGQVVQDPAGGVHRISAVTETAAGVTLETTPASVFDFYADGFYGVRYPTPVIDSPPEGVEIVMTDADGDEPKDGFTVERKGFEIIVDKKTLFGDAVRNDSVAIEWNDAELSFEGTSVKVLARVDYLMVDVKQQTVIASVRAGAGFDSDVALEFAAAETTRPKKLIGLAKTFAVPSLGAAFDVGELGHLNVGLVLELEAEAALAGRVSAHLNYDVTTFMTGHITKPQFGLLNSVWNKITDDTTDLNSLQVDSVNHSQGVTDLDVVAEGSLTLTAKPEVTLRLATSPREPDEECDSAKALDISMGFYAEISAAASAEASSTNGAQLCYTVEWDAGVFASIMPGFIPICPKFEESLIAPEYQRIVPPPSEPEDALCVKLPWVTCTDACAEGSVRCNPDTGTIQSCARTDGCLDWHDGNHCPSDTCADARSCCTQQCAPAGTTCSADGTSVLKCEQNAFGCRRLEPIGCDYGCAHGACRPRPGCVDADSDLHPALTAVYCPTGTDRCDNDPNNWSALGCSACVDQDHDGYGAGCDRGVDCDDADESIHSGCVVDGAPVFSTAPSLPDSVTIPDVLCFTGAVQDDVALRELHLKIEGPLPATTKTVNLGQQRSVSLANVQGLCFDSNNAQYAGVPGNYTLTLIAIDSAGSKSQPHVEQLAIGCSNANVTPLISTTPATALAGSATPVSVTVGAAGAGPLMLHCTATASNYPGTWAGMNGPTFISQAATAGRVELPNFTWTATGPQTIYCTTFDAQNRQCRMNRNIDVVPAQVAPPVEDLAPQGHISVPFTAATGGAPFGDITWSALDQSGLASVMLSYSLDGGVSWTDDPLGDLMAINVGGPKVAGGPFAWSAPDVDSTQALLRLTMTDALGNRGSAVSDLFTIIASSSGGACAALDPPYLTDPGVSSPTGAYDVSWVDPQHLSQYVLEESSSPSFTAVRTTTVSSSPRHVVGAANGTWFYRVKGVSDCTESDWSATQSIQVATNQAPFVPSAPQPANGAVSVSRTPILTWSGGDGEGPVEYAVKLGTDTNNLGFVQAFGASQSVHVGSDLLPGTTYTWQVRARDSDGVVTEGPLWTFTTVGTYADLVASHVTVLGTVAPGATVTTQLSVQNQGTYASLPCKARFYLGRSAGAKEQLLFAGSADVPALAPGASTTVSAMPILDDLRAGTSYITAEIETSGVFPEPVLGNNVVSQSISYADAGPPVIDSVVFRWGLGPSGTQFQSGHPYQVFFQVHDDVGIGCKDFDLFYSGNGGSTWSPIVLAQPSRRSSDSDFYDWTIPPATALTSNALIRLVARDDLDNASSATTTSFQVIDGTGPMVTVTSPNGGEVWSLGQTVNVTWTASAPNGVANVRVYIQHGDITDVLPLVQGNPGTTSWPIPNNSYYASEQVSVRVKATDGLGNETSDWSDAPLAIRDGSGPPPPPWHTPEVVTTTGACAQSTCFWENRRPVLAVDATGNAHLVYVYWQSDYRDGIPGPQYITERIYYRKRTGGVWGPAQIAADLGTQASNELQVSDLDLTLDSAGRPHVAWIRRASASSSDAYACWYNGTSWQAAINVSSDAAFSGTDVSTLATSADDVYVFWMNAGGLRYRSHAAASASWASAANVTGVSSVTSFEARRGTSGRPQVAYTTGSGTLFHIALGASSWGAAAQIDNCSPSVPGYVAAATSDSGAIDAVFSNTGSPARIEHAFSGDALSSCTTLSTGLAGQTPENQARAALDPSGLPSVAWIESGSTSALYVRRMNARPATWSSRVMVNRSTQAPQYGHLGYAVGANGTAHVAWMSYVNGSAEILYNYADLSLDVQAPAVQVLAPAAGDTVAAGATIPIQWSATDAVGVAAIDVRVSTDDGIGWSDLATGLPGTSTSFNWKAASNLIGPALVEVVARDAAGNEGSATQDVVIADTTGPAVQLLAPLGGETLLAGSTAQVQWLDDDAVGVTSVSLYYSTDDGVSWNPIATSIPSTGQYGWTVPEIQTTHARIQVIALDAAGNQGSDASPTQFTIESPNAAPVKAFGPAPADLAAAVAPEYVQLAWTGADPDAGDTLAYDVYVGATASLGAGQQVASGISTTSYDLGELAPLTTYYWRVDASDGTALTTGDMWRFTTGAAAVNAPSNLSAWSPSAGTVRLSWLDLAADETGYQVERSAGLGQSYSLVATLPADTTTFDDTGRSGSTAFVYRVRAVRGGAFSVYSNEASVTTLNTPPYAPTNPSPASGAVNQPLTGALVWVGGDPDPGDTVSYQVLLGTSPTPPVVATTTSTSYLPADLSFREVYYWRVIATDSLGDSMSSALWSFVAEPPPTPIPPVLSAALIGDGAVAITWSGGSSMRDAMRIERRVTGQGFFETAAMADAAATSFLDQGLIGKTSYTYRARTIAGAAISDPSNEVAVAVPNQPPRFASVPAQVVLAGSPWSLILPVADGDGDPMSAGLVTASAGMSLDPDFTLRWTPAPAQIGDHLVVVSADDGSSAVTIEFTVTVESSCSALELCGTGRDEDCDGEIDEGFPDVGAPCSVGSGGCARLGMRVCSDDGMETRCSASEGAPEAERCDDEIDNDCDGKTDGDDEECASAPGPCDPGAKRSCGSDEGACEPGVQRCDPDTAQWGECEDALGPSEEICDDEIDNDCNGTVDDTCPCTTGATRTCGNSTGECKPGRQTCGTDLRWGPCEGAKLPSPELCNGLDDDCDGEVDSPECARDAGVAPCADAGPPSKTARDSDSNCSAIAGRARASRLPWLLFSPLLASLVARIRRRRRSSGDGA